MNETFLAKDDWQLIQPAIAEIERLRAHSVAVLDQSRQLLRMIDNINGPLIRASEDGAGRLDTGANADLRK